MGFLKRLFLLLISLAILGYVVYFIEPPKTWSEASIFQILAFFLPILSSFTFLINFFINHLSKSFILGLGLMVLVVLKSGDQLNLISGSIAVIVIILLTLFFGKSLTRVAKIPKLTRIGGRKRG